MLRARLILGGLAVLVAVAGWTLPTEAQGKARKKILFVTHSGGFIHDSVYEAEKVMKELGEKNGFDVVAWRYTNDLAKLDEYSKRFKGPTGVEVEKENAGRINADTLKEFDAVFFFTTGNPTPTKEETAALLEYVKGGKGFLGTHCATDTLYKNPEYGEMIGAYFDGHPWHTKTRVVVEDPKHPIVSHLGDKFEITDELYQFRDPYSRDKLRVLLRLDPKWVLEQRDIEKKNRETNLTLIRAALEKATTKEDKDRLQAKVKQLESAKSNIKRDDNDYAMAWVRDYGSGRVFYTALGHRKEVWRDPRFQDMIVKAVKWATKEIDGPAAPSGK